MYDDESHLIHCFERPKKKKKLTLLISWCTQSTLTTCLTTFTNITISKRPNEVEGKKIALTQNSILLDEMEVLPPQVACGKKISQNNCQNVQQIANFYFHCNSSSPSLPLFFWSLLQPNKVCSHNKKFLTTIGNEFQSKSWNCELESKEGHA